MEHRVPAVEALFAMKTATQHRADEAPVSRGSVGERAGAPGPRRLTYRPLVSLRDGSVVATHALAGLRPADLGDANLCDPSSAIARMAGQVVVELDEPRWSGSPGEMDTRLAPLRSLGFRVAVADFGAGDGLHVPLVWPDLLRLSRMLTEDLHRSPLHREVVRDLCQIFGQADVQVVAQGVASVAERDLLAALGCPLAEGPLFAGACS
jgi:EAL domain-containing protein (putative c-di-GMP-specific phosphodiesterase class I)